MFVQTENTPNPNSLKFLPGKTVSNYGSFEVTKKDKIDWKPFLNALGSKWKTQIVPLIAKDSNHKDTIQQIEGYPIHPIALNGVDAMGDWYLDYVSGLLKVRLK